ncbi:MAG: hypothetical protein HXS41_06290 [Theionarchaea archaeon]|nr:hypothetical protein [Theionarchaea archaeon]MBU6999642.1 hypothetical protein [Theionarchaea archaeon]MBU7020648.1 hypothetical protein [Theionarchaea archaeon]MBU7035026.1 hypothetical protein [Theionarchaea archaeon]MBU7039822.1 hypothetical protein [Theionarchaea archaeon]
MPYVILDSQTKKRELKKVAPSLYYCTPERLKRYHDSLCFQKRKVKKYRLQQRRKRVGYILMWYKIENHTDKNRKIVHRMIEKSLGFPVARSLIAFPYIHYQPEMPFLSPQRIYARAQSLDITMSRIAVLTPLGKTQERLREKAEHYMRSKYEHLIRRVLKAPYDRKTRSEIRQSYKKLKNKGRTLSVILGINVAKLERKTYTIIWKWEKTGQTQKK